MSLLLITALHAQEPVVVDPEHVRTTIERFAADASWCQQERPLFTSDGQWCDNVPAACPGMAARCRDVPEDTWWDRVLGRLRSFRGRDEAPAPAAPVRLPDPTQVVEVVLVVLALMGLAFVVRAFFVARRPVVGPQGEVFVDDPAAVAPPNHTLADADRAAREGRFEEALMMLRRHAMRGLIERGLARDDPSHTDREVDARMVGRPERDAWRVLMGAIERVRYARRPGDAATVARAREATLRLLGIVTVLLWALPAHAGPTSHDLIVEVADAAGYPVYPLEQAVAPGIGTVILLPEGLSGAADVDSVVEAVQDGAVLILVTTPDADRGELQPFLPTIFLAHPEVRPTGWYTERGAAPGPLVVPGGGWVVPADTPYATVLAESAGTPLAVEAPLGKGEVVTVGLPSLLDDASLLHPANQAFVVALLERYQPDDVLIPMEAPSTSSVAVFQRAGLGPFLLHGLLLVGIAAWWRGRTFAAEVEPVTERRRDFRAHVQAVGRLNSRANAVRRASAAVAAWTLHRLRTRLRLDGGSLVAVIVARTGMTEAEVTAALADAERCAAEPDGFANPDELALLETLWQISTRTLPSRTSPPSLATSGESKGPSTVS